MRFVTGRCASKQICNGNVCEWRHIADKTLSVTKFLIKYAANFFPFFFFFCFSFWKNDHAC